MNSLALLLMSNQYWYGFFLGSMLVLGPAILAVTLLRARNQLHR